MNASPAVVAGVISSLVFAGSAVPMLVKAHRTRDLQSYSLGNLVLINAGNAVHTVYVVSLPFGPIWFLHSFYTVSSLAMLGYYLRHARGASPSAISAPGGRVMGPVPSTSQPSRPRSTSVRLRTTTALGTAVTILAVSAGCAVEPARLQAGTADPAQGPGPTPLASRPPAPFVSDRHGYRLIVPPGWAVVEHDGTWRSFAQFVAGVRLPGEEVISAPDRDAFLVANSMVIPTETGPASWIAGLDSLVDRARPPGCRESAASDVVGGQPASVVTHRCADVTIVGSGLTHRGRGYYFTIGFPTGDAAAANLLEDVVDSIRFTEP
ncbi:hypothetical protein GCM10027053_12390 [Intrasporangium mesophilum]